MSSISCCKLEVSNLDEMALGGGSFSLEGTELSVVTLVIVGLTMFCFFEVNVFKKFR